MAFVLKLGAIVGLWYTALYGNFNPPITTPHERAHTHTQKRIPIIIIEFASDKMMQANSSPQTAKLMINVLSNNIFPDKIHIKLFRQENVRLSQTLSQV